MVSERIVYDVFDVLLNFYAADHASDGVKEYKGTSSAKPSTGEILLRWMVVSTAKVNSHSGLPMKLYTSIYIHIPFHYYGYIYIYIYPSS